MPAHPDPIDVAVGARIRAWRLHRNLSQTSLANALGLTFQQVQKYERGDNRVSASMLVRTAAALDVTVAFLVGEDGSPTSEGPLAQHLATPGAFDLLEAYAAIPKAAVRQAMLRLSGTLAASGARTNSSQSPHRRSMSPSDPERIGRRGG
jgi:transcriptional regulator with XRE-family HTH domain